nr:hypothetical protein [Tanacetum cinerariifolium]
MSDSELNPAFFFIDLHYGADCCFGVFDYGFILRHDKDLSKTMLCWSRSDSSRLGLRSGYEEFPLFRWYIREENPYMKKTDEGVEDGYLSRSLEVNRSGGCHIVDGYGSGHSAGNQRKRIRSMRKGGWMKKLVFGLWVFGCFVLCGLVVCDDCT